MNITHKTNTWKAIHDTLVTSWPEVKWPNGSVQRSAERYAQTIEAALTSGHAYYTLPVDDDDWDTMLALHIAEGTGHSSVISALGQ